MTQKQANDVKHLPLPCYDAIKAIAGERKCPECKGTGAEDISQPLNEPCNLCNGTGKVGWKWEPEVGEWCLTAEGQLCLIEGARGNEILICAEQRIGKVIPFFGDWGCMWYDAKEFIPIFPWETIEGILKGVEYKTELDESSTLYKKFIIWDERQKVSWGVDSLVEGQAVTTYKNWTGKAKSRQEAVMLAVIELGKEIK